MDLGVLDANFGSIIVLMMLVFPVWESPTKRTLNWTSYCLTFCLIAFSRYCFSLAENSSPLPVISSIVSPKGTGKLWTDAADSLLCGSIGHSEKSSKSLLDDWSLSDLLSISSSDFCKAWKRELSLWRRESSSCLSTMLVSFSCQTSAWVRWRRANLRPSVFLVVRECWLPWLRGEEWAVRFDVRGGDPSFSLSQGETSVSRPAEL